MDHKSIGIIGGADGPTKIFISGNPLSEIIASVVIVASIVGIVVFLKKRK
jgi:Na+-transporting methylmalonyl-CoA/oxaloacetate decarboxylase beta subunit